MIPAYLSALKTEMDGVRAYYNTPLSFTTIYIGGGTPTLLTIDQLAGLINIVRAYCLPVPALPAGRRQAGNTPQHIEFTIESNPGTIDIEKLKFLRSQGINRLSLGAQSFDDNELKLLGRIHNSKQIYAAFEAARKAGFENINLDLIFALPGQSLESWERTLKKSIDLSPEHISAYNLQIEEGTPFYNKYSPEIKIDHKTSVRAYCNTPLPDNDHEYSMFKESIDALKSSGYHHYEISNFAKPGFECKHNINYWKNGDYPGLGLSAASHIGFERHENTKDIDEYLKDPVRAYCNTPRPIKEDIIETIIMGFRLIEGIDLEAFRIKYGKDLLELYPEQTELLIAEGLVDLKSGHLLLMDKGIFLLNRVLEYFV